MRMANTILPLLRIPILASFMITIKLPFIICRSVVHGDECFGIATPPPYS